VQKARVYLGQMVTNQVGRSTVYDEQKENGMNAAKVNRIVNIWK